MAINLLDGCILVILVISLIKGYKKGFISALAGIVSTLAGLAAAFIYRQPAADYLQKNYRVVSVLTTFLEKHLAISTGISSQPGWLSSLPGVTQGLAVLHQQITEIAYGLVAALCFLILYMIVKHLIRLICLILEKILPGGLLGGMNRLGGGALLLTQNILIMAALFGTLASPLAMAAQVGTKGLAPFAAQVQGSLLVPGLLRIFVWLQALIVKLV